jgi:hypothetical protein
MAQTSLPSTAAPERASLRRTYVAGGIGGIMAFSFWLLQPIIVSVMAAGGDDLYGTHQYVLTYRWNGLYEAVAFSGVGVGVLASVLATSQLVSTRAPHASTWLRVGQVLGIVGGAAWIVVAGLSLAPFTSVGFFLNELVPNAPEQAVVYEVMGLVITAMAMTFALAMVGWLLSFAFGARSRGIIGWPLAVLAIVCAAVSASPLFLPFSPPWGAIGPLLYLLVLGVALLVKGRKAA